jgi:ABC-type transport system substrate-binding protein
MDKNGRNKQVRASKLGRWRWVAAIAVLAIVAAACTSGTTTTSGAPSQTTGTTGATGGTTTTAASSGEVADYSYKLGIFQDTTTDNFWSSLDNASTVWNSYVLTPTKPALWTLAYPGIEIVNDVATDEAPPAGAAFTGDWSIDVTVLTDDDEDPETAPVRSTETVTGSGGWEITVPMRAEAMWSDGSPITADDFVFTYNTAKDIALGGSWLTYFPTPDPANPDKIALVSAEATDPNTLVLRFNKAPGLAIWPHGPGFAPIMSSAFWGDTVEAAKASDDPTAELYAAAGAGDLSGGQVIFDSRTEGVGAKNVANVGYYDKGRPVTSGGVTYDTGPFVKESVFTLYGGQDAAVLALKAGDVDYLLNPLGMQRGLLSQVQGDPNLTAVVNPTNGFRYLAFNLRKEPMSLPQFRDALALMIDKEFMANNVLQGVAFPLYATVPEGNTAWYDAAIADEIASTYVGKTTSERLAGAITLLKEVGFSWEVEPTMDCAPDCSADNPGTTIIAGSGLLKDGAPYTEELEILAPGPGYDPLRATYSIWIETWLNQLGFNASANPTDFNTIVDAVFVPTEAGELDYDMYILGWSLGDPSLPTYHADFWASRSDTLTSGGNNNTGFNNADFDALVDQFEATTDEAEAKGIMWQEEQILATEKPYILLFDTGILEFYRQANVNYPFTESLSGLQFLSGMQGQVTSAK